MDRFRPVIGSPVIAEDIEKANILQDDVTREVVAKFRNRQTTKRAYVEYVMERLDKTGRYDNLVKVLGRLVEENEPVKVEYAHDPDIEAPKVIDLKITQKGDVVGWKDVFARCLESIEGNENITRVGWPLLPTLIFECLFAGERLNPKFQGLTLDEFAVKFTEEFNSRFSVLKEKEIILRHMSEDKRHNNRNMYNWADKNCPPLVERGIPYSETLSDTSQSLMEKYIETTFGTVGARKRVMFKDGFEYFLDRGKLYRWRLGESKKQYVEVQKDVKTLEEAKHYAERATASTMVEAVRRWWESLPEYDRIFVQEDRHLPTTDWAALTTEDRKVLVEVHRGR